MVKRIFSFTYIGVAVVLSIYSTIAQTQPALFFIELLTVDGKYPVKITMLLTMLALLLPMVIVLVILSRFSNQKNAQQIRALQPGQTGIILHRKTHMTGVLQDWKIVVNDRPVQNISAGAYVFLPLQPGLNTITVKAGLRYSAPLSITVEQGQITNLEAGMNDDKIRGEVLKVNRESLYLVQRPV